MIAVLKNGTTPEQRDSLCKWFESMGLSCHVSQGEFHTIIGLIGDVSKVDIEMLESLSIVERVTRISDPFKKANRKFHEEPTVVDVSGVKIGGGHFQIIAGPCSVESREQIIADKINRLENIHIKGKFDYNAIQSLSTEARQKLTRIDPDTIAQASRIPGISPSDINILLVMLGR